LEDVTSIKSYEGGEGDREREIMKIGREKQKSNSE